MASGIFITLEGIDGAGKTTLARGLGESLSARGHRVELLREPGGVAASERVRSLLIDPGLEIGDRAEALLYAAARAQLVEERVRPLIAEGALVLLDRFVDSSLVYQGIGRGLGIAAIAAVNTFATCGLRPDRTLLLKLDPALARARARRRAGDDEPDRLEREDESFFRTLAAGYEEIATAEPDRVRTLDAAASPAQVLAAALAALADLA